MKNIEIFHFILLTLDTNQIIYIFYQIKHNFMVLVTSRSFQLFIIKAYIKPWSTLFQRYGDILSSSIFLIKV